MGGGGSEGGRRVISTRVYFAHGPRRRYVYLAIKVHAPEFQCYCCCSCCDPQLDVTLWESSVYAIAH